MKNCMTCAYHEKNNRGLYCCCEKSPQYTEYVDPLKRCEYHVNQKDCITATGTEEEDDLTRMIRAVSKDFYEFLSSLFESKKT